MGFLTALAVAGTAMSAVGAAKQASAQKKSAAYNKQVALQNAEIAEDNARDVELRGRQAVYAQGIQIGKDLATARAATAGAGLVVDQAGTTPQALVQEMAAAGALDVMRLRNNIENEKRRALQQGADFQAQAQQFELQRSSISPFRSALIAGTSSALNNRDILFS